MYEIALLNPLRFIDTSEVNYSFDGNFSVLQALNWQSPKCYFQPWQRSDTLKLQILFDSAPSDLLITDVVTGSVKANIPWGIIDTNIVGYDFKAYEISFPFTSLQEGRYQASFNYTDGDGKFHQLLSEGLDLKDVQENTLLIKYKHSQNDFDVLFDTKIEFQFRVQAAIKNFNPKNNRVVYNDQKVNATQLYAAPYRTFKFILGYQYGVPTWVVDKINWIQSLDQVSYNNVFYQVLSGAEYEYTTNDDNNWMGGTIDVQPVDNNFKRYKTNPNGANEWIPMQKILRYMGQSADLVIAGKFNNFSDLEKILITKRTAPEFELKVGVNPGGDEIGRFTVNQNENTYTIEWKFEATTTIYLTGLAGADTDVYVLYKQLDEAPVPVTPAPDVTSFGAKGTCAIYREVTPGDLAIHWNLATGLGNANTPYAGWAWRDGRNGTDNMAGLPSVGFDFNDLTKVGTISGNNQITIAKANLPAVGLSFTVERSSSREWRTGGGSGRPIMRVGNVGEYPTLGPEVTYTENMGAGTPIDFTIKGRIEIPIIKLVD